MTHRDLADAYARLADAVESVGRVGAQYAVAYDGTAAAFLVPPLLALSDETRRLARSLRLVSAAHRNEASK